MSTLASPETRPAHEGESAVRRFLGKFLVLRGAMRELWLVFGIKFLGIGAYKITNLTLVLWLVSDFGFTDQKALGVVPAWSLLMTVFTLLVGSLTDALGLRRTFFLGVWVCILARAVMAFTSHKWIALAGGMVPLAIGEALGTPVLVAAVRRYSNTHQRSISFSLFYTVMNAGFLAAACLFDFVRHRFGEHTGFSFPLVGLKFSTYQTLLLLALCIEVCLLPLVYFLREGAEATDEGPRIVPRLPAHTNENMWNSFRLTVRDGCRQTGCLFASLVSQQGFYRLIAFLMLIAFLKLIFMQMDFAFPLFGIRELGNGAPVGRLWGLNNVLVILLVPLVGALTQRFPAYPMVVLGGAISAASVFIMALPSSWFQPLADTPVAQWMGHHLLDLKGAIHPYYAMIPVFIVFLSIGEAFYSPRVYEYAAAIAPKGQEASYGALSYVPFLLAKLLVGTFSGTLLARYCPAEGERHSSTMWLIVAMIATIAPLGLILFRRYVRVQEAGRPGTQAV